MPNNLYKLILVDDEELLLKSLVRELTPWSKDNRVEIITFNSGYDALKYLKENSKTVFLVISDLRMPTLSGTDFLQNINSLYPEIKLFLLTAYSEIPAIQAAIKSSINRLLLKPWDSVSLENDVDEAFKSYKTEEQNRKLREELALNIKLAGEFQRKLLPKIESIKGIMDLDMVYEPVNKLQCGGDYYDFCNVEDNRQLILMGDVTGHGVRPAFVTAMLKVLCSMYRPKLNSKDISPGEIVSYFNQGLYKSLGDINDILATLTIILIDHKNKKLTFSGAGQLPIYILRSDKLILLDSDEVAMGFVHDIEYKDTTVDLETGDLIIMFTDGLIESESTKTVIDKDRIRSLLLTLDLTSSPALKIKEAFKTLLGDKEFADDVTLITSRIL